jgi:hypothetical protein
MRKSLLTICALALTYISTAQVTVAGVSPQSIVANYAHTWVGPADGWGSPDFGIPGTFVQDTLKLADDGTPGLNAQGNPVSASGCNSLAPGSLAGKIAVIFRGDGTTNANSGGCEFGLKAFNAEQAGAVAVIIINRIPNEVINMGAGADGSNVTIPVVMINLIDGVSIVSEMSNGPVVMFLGNKIGLYPNDVSLNANKAFAPKGGMVHSLLAQNGTEFNFEVGANITNQGSSAQTAISLNAKITSPSGATVYDNTISNLTMNAADTTGIDVYPGQVNSFPAFALANYPQGTYTLTYTADLGAPDDYANDNVLQFTFTINDSLFSYSAIDPTTNAMAATNFYRPSTNTNSYSICTVIKDPNASRVAVTGLYFAATTAAGTLLDGQEIILSLYTWDDVFTDLNDANFPANNSWNINEISSGNYYYSGELQGDVVYGEFTDPIVLADNQRYLACAQTFDLQVYLGYGSQNYTWNTDYYLQPTFPNESDLSRFPIGFGSDVPSALGIGLINKNNIGLGEESMISGVAYPNPATDLVTISIEGEGGANLTVTDLAGRVAMTNNVTLTAGTAELNIANLEAGVYIFNVVLENGKTAQFNVVKK